MKRKNLTLMTLGVLAGGLLSSCTVEDTPSLNETGSMLVKSPYVQVYSGSGNSKTYWDPFNGGTRAFNQGSDFFKVADYENKGDNWNDWEKENIEYYKYKDNAPGKTDRGESVSTAEYDYVMEYIKTHPDAESVECPLTNFFIQNVGSSYDEYQLEFIQDDGTLHHTQEVVGGQKIDRLNFNGNDVPDFNASGGNRALILNGDASNPMFHDSYGDNWDTEAYKYYLITLPDDPIYGENAGKTAYYLAFDYRTKKYDNGQCNFEGDGIYNDWVVKLTPADGKILPPTENGNGNDTEPETCDKCGDSMLHHNDEGVCSDCQEAGRQGADSCNPGSNEKADPSKPDDGGKDTPEVTNPAVPGDNHTNEVEVNLHGTDKGDYLESHLSIHVRAATDVEIFIPIPQEYYVPADDMAIVMQHEPNHMLHGQKPVEGMENVFVTSYTLKDSDFVVKLTIAYEEGGIRITTDGITQEVIDWCREKVQDGITFEIWNYFPEELGLDALKEYLNQATIKFLDEEPDYYINAFTEEGGEKDPDDCKVSIVDDQKDDYGNPTIGEHLNGSTKNVIRERNNHQEEDVPSAPTY